MRPRSYTDHFTPDNAVDPGAGGVPDAPSDSQLYARKDGAWVIVPPSGFVAVVDYSYNTNTSPPPGGGQIRLNADPAASLPTLLWASYDSSPGVDQSIVLRNTLINGTTLLLQDKDNAQNTIQMTCTGATDQGGYFEISIGSPTIKGVLKSGRFLLFIKTSSS
jgi:hypothetical protein